MEQIQADADIVYDFYKKGKTRCRICNYPMMVDGTRAFELEKNKRLLIRWMKCIGPGNHRYVLKEIIVKEVIPSNPSVQSVRKKKRKK